MFFEQAVQGFRYGIVNFVAEGVAYGLRDFFRLEVGVVPVQHLVEYLFQFAVLRDALGNFFRDLLGRNVEGL